MEVDVRIFYPEPPAFAEFAPTRAVYVGDANGRCEVHTWDGASRTARQVTDRPQGTVTCAIDPTGQDVWWFDDDVTGVGTWRVRPFDGTEPGVPAGFPSGRAGGLAMAADRTVAVGLVDDSGLAAYLRRPGEPVLLCARTSGYAYLVDLSGDGTLVALAGEPDGPDAVTVLDTTSGTRTTLAGTGGSVWAGGFAPGAGEPRLLLTVAHGDGYRIALWTARDGTTELDWCEFDTEVAPSWYPDGTRLLARQDRHGRSTLYEIDLTARTRTTMDTPPGTILAATAQPDGDVHYVWTDSTHAPSLRTRSGLRLPAGPVDGRQPGSWDEVWVDGPGGRVHALLTLPDRPGPHPAVFLLHGGPFDAAKDAYDPLVSVFVSIGCAVVRPNYRGSTGYGRAWREAARNDVGLSALADVAAVRERLVRDDVIVPGLTAVCGESWGGYLALLAAGTQPELWHAVAAASPIADYPAAFAETTAAVRSLDMALFGGTPDEVPGEYLRSSPATYVDAVRAPVLITAGTDDPKCPPGQINRYVAALSRRGLRPRLEWTKTGHEGYETAARVHVLHSLVSFVATALGGHQVATPVGTGQSGRPVT